jgi:hypothetical protein
LAVHPLLVQVLGRVDLRRVQAVRIPVIPVIPGTIAVLRHGRQMRVHRDLTHDLIPAMIAVLRPGPPMRDHRDLTLDLTHDLIPVWVAAAIVGLQVVPTLAMIVVRAVVRRILVPRVLAIRAMIAVLQVGSEVAARADLRRPTVAVHLGLARDPQDRGAPMIDMSVMTVRGALIACQNRILPMKLGLINSTSRSLSSCAHFLMDWRKSLLVIS